jgi:hypothetical protein
MPHNSSPVHLHPRHPVKHSLLHNPQRPSTPYNIMAEDRFARLKTDPRFRRPKQKQLKVEIDSRFKDVLESEEFGGKGKGKASDGELRLDPSPNLVLIYSPG